MRLFYFFFIATVFISCSASRHYNFAKKYPPGELRADYDLLRKILEAKHPSLYWYTSKDSMDMYFTRFREEIKDSMTEVNFAWHILAPLVEKIRCGHTSVSFSKEYKKWAKGKQFPGFPMYMKFWNDTMAVYVNLDKKDSIFKRGTIIKSINGVTADGFIKRMSEYLPTDGYADNINLIRISANFPYYHRSIYGLSKKYSVEYVDSLGNSKVDSVPVFQFKRDSTAKDSVIRPSKKELPKQKRIERYRSLRIDSSGQFAVMTLNSFSEGRLRTFFRRSFKVLRKRGISNLILDIRGNGGGRVSWSSLLTQYISRTPFRFCDTAISGTQSLSPYSRYITESFFTNLELFFISRKEKDGKYHVRSMEKKVKQPKRRNHYNGKVYVLINGPTFSAASIFSNLVKGQDGIKLVGEETGGGWYGNNGVLIPDIVLPQTHIKVRLPLFRIVQYHHISEKGTGVFPDIFVPTSLEALKKGVDQKMEFVKELIRLDGQENLQSGTDPHH